jgi:hypothetical protein
MSAPPSPSGKTQPALILKLVPYTKDNSIITYFTLADSKTNQVAGNGLLQVQVYTTTSLSFSSGEGNSYNGIGMKNMLYEGSFNVGKTNFHWESFGSLLKVEDLACRFIIPYDRIEKKFTPGKLATMEVNFRPEASSQNLRGRAQFSLY